MSITISILPELKQSFKDKCSPIAYSKILRALIRAFINGQIKLEDLEVE